MRSLALALWFSLGAGCSTYTLHHGNRMGIAAATLTLACDAGQTMYAMHDGGYREQNPMLGSTPSETTVGVYFAATMLATGLAWWALPEEWRPMLWGSITAVEVHAIAGNSLQPDPIPVCGV